MATDYSTLSIEELIALRGKRQLRNRGIYKSPQWWQQFRDKIKSIAEVDNDKYNQS